MGDGLDKLYADARDQNLIIEKASYQLVSESDNHLERYDITLPIKGSYPQLRQFIARLLRDLPNLTLQTVSFNRLTKEDTAVETELQLSMYFREK